MGEVPIAALLNYIPSSNLHRFSSDVGDFLSICSKAQVC